MTTDELIAAQPIEECADAVRTLVAALDEACEKLIAATGERDYWRDLYQGLRLAEGQGL